MCIAPNANKNCKSGKKTEETDTTGISNYFSFLFFKSFFAI